jgi:CxxC-x17-CxxC domain-containing protein
MNNYSKEGRGGFKGGYKSKFGGDRGGSRPVSMHSATCGSCGKDCEVPFRPTQDRPVYCKSCFDGKEHMSGERRPRTTEGGGESVKKQLDAINEKLEKLIAIVQELSTK